MTKAISRFEVNLLRAFRGLLQQAPVEQVLPLLTRRLPRPKCLSRDAVELIQDTLAKGCVQFLARSGWMRERFLRDAKIAEGRLWQRTPPAELGLTFSGNALEFLLQLVSGTIGKVVPKVNDLTLGDRLLLFLAFDVLRQTELAGELRKEWLPLHQDGLCRLAFIEELAEGPGRFRIDWLTWTTGLGASILETLQGWLADRWTALERKKETITTPARIRKIGATQTRVFGEYLDVLDQASRWDLARCFLDAGRRLLRDQPTARKWTGNLDVSNQRVADRVATYRDALAFVQQMERLDQWNQRAGSVGYFDEGYAASQLWKADWERLEGAQMCERARAILHEVEPV
jgi:FtsH ternary system domain X6